MNKLSALLLLFRKGHAVSNPEAWKKRQIEATVLGGVIVAIVQVLHAFGYELPVTAEDATIIAAGFIGIVNIVLTYSTTDKIGLPGKTNKPELQASTELGNKQDGVERIHEPETTEASVQSEPIEQKQPSIKPSEYKSIYDFDHYRN